MTQCTLYPSLVSAQGEGKDADSTIFGGCSPPSIGFGTLTVFGLAHRICSDISG